MTHTPREIAKVLRMLDLHGDREIAERTGIPRRTIADWRHGRVPRSRRGSSMCPVCGQRDWGTVAPPTYAYLLGLYLGDGYICRSQRTYRLRFTLDAAYPGIVRSAASGLEELMLGRTAWVRARGDCRCVEVSMYSNHWPCFFPQHGPGKKHEREITLAPWQESVVAHAHREFLRGLIHSDGCRVVALDRGRPSVRYHFANRSEDIKALFCNSLEALGLTWTRPSEVQVAVYKKRCVAVLDEFIGPKS